MKTIIIFEGVDCSGKSTLLNSFSKKLGKGVMIKNLVKPRHKDEDVKSQYQDIINMIDRSDIDYFVFDRYYPSQAVYSYLRGNDEIDDHWYTNFELVLLKKFNVVFVLVDEDLDIIEERMQRRGDDYVTINMLQNLKKRYEHFFVTSCIRKKIKVKSTDDHEENITMILEKMQ